MRLGDNMVTTPLKTMGAFEARKKEQVENDEEVEGDKHENAKEPFKFTVSPNRMGDNGGSEPTKTTIWQARANDDKEKESFKLVVPTNREISEV